MQSRLRKRGRKGKWTYTHTIRKQVSGQVIEVKTPLSHRDYSNLISQEDANHFLVYKTRRCFLYLNQYFQLDIYKEPCHERCMGLMLLETYTTLDAEELKQRLPDFLNIGIDIGFCWLFPVYLVIFLSGQKFLLIVSWLTTDFQFFVRSLNNFL